VYQRGDYLFLDTEPELPSKLYEHLDKFIIADDVTLADETGEWAAIGVEGPESERILSKLGIATRLAALGTSSWQDGFVAAASVTGAQGFRLFVPMPSKQKLIEALQTVGIVEADKEAVETVRLENGKPRYGSDITERYLTQETNQMQAVSFTKGCYIGQEIVERVRSRAQIHRMLHAVRVKGNQALPAGTKLVANGAPAGEITSAAFSPALGEVAALGYIRVEQVQAKPVMAVEGTDPAMEAYLV
jgi:aminomethyltransferase